MGVCVLLSSCEGRPTATKDRKAEKYAEVVDAFNGETTDDGGEHATGIRQFYDDFGHATSKRGPARVKDVFDSRMTVRLLKQEKLLPGAYSRLSEDSLVKSVEQHLGQMLADPESGLTWKRFEIFRVLFNRDETKAVVYSRHWDTDGPPGKMRWWLSCRDGKWRAYDFEILEMSFRFSTGVGMGFMMAGPDNPLPRLMQAIAVVEVDPEKGVKMLDELEGVEFPPSIESARLMAIASALNYLQRYEEALDAADRAISVKSDLPRLHLVYAACHNGLKQYEKALENAEQYAELLGTEADYYVEVGDAYAGMGRTADAIVAYESGLTDDPQSLHNILGLMKVLPDDQRDTLMTYYKQLDGLDESFNAMAEQLIQHEDATTLRTLIDTHKMAAPNSKNIDKCEKMLSRLEGDGES